MWRSLRTTIRCCGRRVFERGRKNNDRSWCCGADVIPFIGTTLSLFIYYIYIYISYIIYVYMLCFSSNAFDGRCIRERPILGNLWFFDLIGAVVRSWLVSNICDVVVLFALPSGLINATDWVWSPAGIVCVERWKRFDSDGGPALRSYDAASNGIAQLSNHISTHCNTISIYHFHTLYTTQSQVLVRRCVCVRVDL